MKQLTKQAITVIAYVLGIYLILRAAIEPFIITYSKPETYMNDWGGPTYVGVLAVHMVPGLISLALIAWHLKKKLRKDS